MSADDRYDISLSTTMPEAWSDWLETFSDGNLYQSGWYGRIRTGRSRLKHVVVSHRGVPVAMLQLHVADIKGLRTGIAYSRGGPVFDRRQQSYDEGALSFMADFIDREFVVRRGLYLRIIPNAYVGTDRALALERSFSRFRKNADGDSEIRRTFVLDLSPPLDVLRKNLEQKWRNCLNRAERNQLVVTRSSDFASFTPLYNEMMGRKQFSSDVKLDEFAQLQNHLPERQRMQILICIQDGAPVAGLVASTLGETGVYLHGATGDRGLQAKGSYLLQWEMIQWLKQNGFRYYDLGGINQERNPGVFRFKQGLSGREMVYMGSLSLCRNPLSAIGAKLLVAVKRKTLWTYLRRAGRPVASHAAGTPANRSVD